jgi:hypothetical protein
MVGFLDQLSPSNSNATDGSVTQSNIVKGEKALEWLLFSDKSITFEDFMSGLECAIKNFKTVNQHRLLLAQLA